jgi:crotonobetainyl-CoA:carnitine CoA-transferase CaiB-like acyl-CoA transferase
MMTDLSVRFSDTRAETTRLQPKFGEHSVEVLGEAGLSEGEIAQLIASGATLDGRPAARAAE